MSVRGRDRFLPSWYFGGSGDSSYYPVGADCVLYHAYWDGTGTDHSIYGNDATLTGGSFGELGASLDGIDDIITVVHADSMDFGTSDFTLAMWVNYTNTIGHGNDQNFMSIWGQTPGWSGIGLKILGIDGGFDRPHSYTYLNAAYPYSVYENPGTVVESNKWLFMAYIIDRDVGGYFYCNGNMLVGPLGTTDVVNSFTSNHQIRIGGGNTAWDGPALMSGTIGEDYAFNTAKSEAQLDDIYNATKARYGL